MMYQMPMFSLHPAEAPAVGFEQCCLMSLQAVHHACGMCAPSTPEPDPGMHSAAQHKCGTKHQPLILPATQARSFDRTRLV